MKAVRLRSHAGTSGIVCEEVPGPRPGKGEVLVRVHAAAVTPTELQWGPTSSTPAGDPRPLPLIPGHEFSGEIVALGPDVSGLKEGDAVFGMNDWFRDGAQAELCVARAEEVAKKPRRVDHVAAGAAPISALTAWQGLMQRAHLAAGQLVLIHGAAGGVGNLAVQLARWRGAKVIGTASAGNLEFLRSLGVQEAIDYRARRFEEQVRDVDVVFDTVGGETLDRSWGVLKPGGRLITVASSGAGARERRVREAFFIVEANRSQLGEIAGLMDAGEVLPVVGAVFPLSRARQAYEHKPARGKTILRIKD